MNSEQPVYEVLLDMLRTMVKRQASDLFLSVGFPPALKIDGLVTPISAQPLTDPHTKALVRVLMNDKQFASFEATKECNFAVAPAGIGRFRASAYIDQNGVGIVLRTITTYVPPTA